MKTLYTTMLKENSIKQDILINCDNILYIEANENCSKNSIITLINNEKIIVDEYFENLIEILHNN